MFTDERDSAAFTFKHDNESLLSQDSCQRCRNNPEVGNHELGKKCDKVVNDSADPASSRPRLREGPGDERGKWKKCILFLVYCFFRKENSCIAVVVPMY